MIHGSTNTTTNTGRECGPATREVQIERSVLNATRLSRTVNGVSDTSVSSHKEPVSLSGEPLAERARENLKSSIRYLLSVAEIPLRSQEEATVRFTTSIRLCNEGLLGDPLALRQWEGFPGHPTPAELPALMEQFQRELVVWDPARLTAPIEYAAWIEQRFDHQIHSLYDGCGRVARSHAMAALIHAGISYPQFPNRDEYLAERGRELLRWTEYYRSLCSVS
jgi:hypothetical protein